MTLGTDSFSDFSDRTKRPLPGLEEGMGGQQATQGMSNPQRQQAPAPPAPMPPPSPQQQQQPAGSGMQLQVMPPNYQQAPPQATQHPLFAKSPAHQNRGMEFQMNRPSRQPLSQAGLDNQAWIQQNGRMRPPEGGVPAGYANSQFQQPQGMMGNDKLQAIIQQLRSPANAQFGASGNLQAMNTAGQGVMDQRAQQIAAMQQQNSSPLTAQMAGSPRHGLLPFRPNADGTLPGLKEPWDVQPDPNQGVNTDPYPGVVQPDGSVTYDGEAPAAGGGDTWIGDGGNGGGPGDSVSDDGFGDVGINKIKNQITGGVNPHVAGAAGNMIAGEGQQIAQNLFPGLFEEGFLGQVNGNLVDPTTQQDYITGAGGVLRHSKGQLEAAGQGDPMVRKAMEMRLQGLGKGLTPQEREALSFGNRQDINSQLSTGLRAAQAAGLRSGVGAGSGVLANRMAPAVQQAIQARQGLAADLNAKDLSLREQRNQAFSDLAQSEAMNFHNRNQQALNTFGNFANQAKLNDQQVQQFNLNQAAKEIAAQVDATGGGISLIQNMLGMGMDQANIKAIMEAEKKNNEAIVGILGQ